MLKSNKYASFQVFVCTREPSIKGARTFSVILNHRLFLLSTPVHICLTLLPLVRVDAYFELGGSPTSSIHLHHLSLSIKTRKVSHNKVKYLSITLMQDKSRERINIYLKISYGNMKKICFKKPVYYPVSTNKCTLLTLINAGFQVLSRSIKIWDKI